MYKLIEISDDFMQLLYGFKNLMVNKPLPVQKSLYVSLNAICKDEVNLDEDILSYKFHFYNLLKSSSLLMYKAYSLIGHGAAAEKHLHYIQKFAYSYYDDAIMKQICCFYNNIYKYSELDIKNKCYHKKRDSVDKKILNYYVLLYEWAPSFNKMIELFQETNSITLLRIAVFAFQSSVNQFNLLSLLSASQKYTLKHYFCFILLAEKMKDINALKAIILQALQFTGSTPDWECIRNAILHLYNKDSKCVTPLKITHLKDIELYIIGYSINFLVSTEKVDAAELLSILKDLYDIAINSFNYINIQLISHLIANYLTPLQAACVKYHCLNYSFKLIQQMLFKSDIKNQSLKFITCEKLQTTILNSLSQNSPQPKITMEIIEREFKDVVIYMQNHTEDEIVMVSSDWPLIIPEIRQMSVSFYSIESESKVEVNTISKFENLYMQFLKTLQSVYVWYDKLIERENQREIKLRIAVEEKQLSKILDDFAEDAFGTYKYLLLGKYNKQIEHSIHKIAAQINTDVSPNVLHKCINYMLTKNTAQEIDIPPHLQQQIQQIKVGELRSSTYLLIDNKISLFPFERLRIYKEECQRITRLLTIESIPQPYTIDPFNGFYVLNPSGDLKSTQERLENYFVSKRMWNGIAGMVPTAKDIINALTTKDIFMYIAN